MDGKTITMPGGYGNIKSEDGKPFKAGNKMAEKWTLKEAEKLANDLLDWLEEQHTDEDGNKRDKGNIFISEFVATRRLPPRILNYLAKKFSAFSTLMEIAKNIQEAKLLKYGTADRLNASMTKFCLINHHGYTDKSQVDHTTGGEKINDVKFTVADPATIEKVEKLLNGEGPGQ